MRMIKCFQFIPGECDCECEIAQNSLPDRTWPYLPKTKGNEVECGAIIHTPVVAILLRAGFVRMTSIWLTNAKWKYATVNDNLRAIFCKTLTLINFTKVKYIEA